ncbi:PepSY domain-containing protein [Altererythrobacter arenosus]|uniref:PepSY domain-containing protein n=1 Tax=Altererythrobacter arenosus TaxID=3032592 RepID=A0ABY8FMT2_9SPHN|nr:PepSY domain-containing protein [Altererythrobacter sp. CAU 1644]WFL76331.1 PepSY domain-containing protein [Altererythrobacter sp. CAU 1644]
MSMVSARTYRFLRPIHKYAGLLAALWLLVMGITGVMLDHHEWRWLNQNSVPAEWTSERVGRLVPGTVIRHIAVEDQRIFGASERGAWFSDDGKSWSPVDFEGISGQPQTNGIAQLGEGFAGAYLATDDGIWRLGPDGRSATRAGLEGRHLTALSEGHGDGTLLAVEEKSALVAYDLASERAREIDISANVSGLSPTMPLHRFVMDIHFGRALLPGNWSIWLNDLGGVALAVLSITGIGYWYITRRGRRRGMTMKTQRGIMRWMFRGHAPVIGLLGLIPILYISLSAFPMNHIYGFLDWAQGREISRASLPAAYQAVTFDHEIDGAVAWPDDPDRISLATRFGVLETRDGGKSWASDISIPLEPGAPGANLFRIGDTVFAAFGGGDNFARTSGSDEWQPLAGTTRALTGGARDGEALYLKNSQAIYRGDSLSAEFADTGIDFASAAPGTPLFLYIVDIHVGLIFHDEFKWANDLFAALALLLALSGPVMWLRRKWI